MQQHTNAKLGKGSKVFTGKSRNLHEINTNTCKSDEANSMSVPRMTLFEAKLARAKEMAINNKKVKEQQETSQKDPERIWIKFNKEQLQNGNTLSYSIMHATTDKFMETKGGTSKVTATHALNNINSAAKPANNILDQQCY